MRRFGITAVCVAAVILALAGCGASAHHKAATQTQAQVSSVGTQTTAGPQAKKSKHRTSARSHVAGRHTQAGAKSHGISRSTKVSARNWRRRAFAPVPTRDRRFVFVANMTCAKARGKVSGPGPPPTSAGLRSYARRVLPNAKRVSAALQRLGHLEVVGPLLYEYKQLIGLLQRVEVSNAGQAEVRRLGIIQHDAQNAAAHAHMPVCAPLP